MPTTSAPQQQISATTNSGVSNTSPAVLSTVVIPAPKNIYNDTNDYDEFSGDFSPRVFRDNQKDVFTVEFKDLKGKPGKFHFDLLPAIENRGGGNIRAGDVPEVKPGILRMLETRHKNIVVPGATPVVQSIGIKSALINLVGCFTGAEGKSAESKYKQDVLIGKFGETKDPDSDAYVKATAFHNEVVLPMTQVKVTVQASRGANGVTTMVYEGVIIKFKDYAVRSNRNYYTIDLLVTKYASQQSSTPTKSEEEQTLDKASPDDKAAIQNAEQELKTAEENLREAEENLNKAARGETGDISKERKARTEAEAAVKKAKEALETAKRSAIEKIKGTSLEIEPKESNP